MPFRSVEQRNLLAWKHPDIYRRWKAEHGTKIVPKKRADHEAAAAPATPIGEEPAPRKAKSFERLRGRLTGISDRALDHHLELYRRYVERLNDTGELTRETEVLFAKPVADLKLKIEGRLAYELDRLHAALLARGIEFWPDFYLGDDHFWTTDGIAINVPWFLANNRLWRLVNERTSRFTLAEVHQVIRHETGHALMQAFNLNDRRAWRDYFGDVELPPTDAKPDPVGNEFVRYLKRPGEQHQAQKHPSEDFAETFATWLDEPGWKTRYTGLAFEKILYVDRLANEGAFAGVTPLRDPGRRIPYTELGGTVGQFVGAGPAAPGADDAELLDTEVSDLELEPTGALQEALDQVHQEIQDRAITAWPEFYLGDPDFWTVDRHFAVNVPWFLATAQLWRLANQNERTSYSVDAVKRCLRHEIGHALGYAFRLWRTPEWAELFGDFRAPYRQRFTPDPSSTDFVEYLKDVPAHYGQKHPDEDWAETFAAWLDPDSDWEARYADWPGALAKLRYADKVGRAILIGAPKVTSPGNISPYRESVRGTVAQALQLQAAPHRPENLENAIRYHELYFENLGGAGGPGPGLVELADESFGSIEEWLHDLRATARDFSAGWILTVWDPVADRIRNVAVDGHGDGPAGCPIVLALDLWEHASLIDYAGAPYIYIAAFLRNIDWRVVERRIEDLPARVAPAAQLAPAAAPAEQAKYAGGPGDAGGGGWNEALHPRGEAGRFTDKPDSGFKLRGPSVNEHFGQGHPHRDTHEQFAARWVHANGREDVHTVANLGHLLAGRPDQSAGELGKAFYKGHEANGQEDLGKLSEFAHEYYQATQAALAHAGIKGEVKVYRGVSANQAERIQATSGPGQKIEVEVDPLSSWTTDKAQAEEHFSNPAGAHGVVLEATMPVSRIFAHHAVDAAFRETAYEQEKEVVLYSPDQKVRATIVDEPANVRHWERAHRGSYHDEQNMMLVDRQLDTRNGKFQVKIWVKPADVREGDKVIGHPASGMVEQLGHEPVGRPWIAHTYGMVDQSVLSPHNYDQMTGKLTPERAKLHDEIVSKALAVKEPRRPDEQPQAILTMGAPGSGKGVLVKQFEEKLRGGAVKIDADEIKEHLPEYQEAVKAYASDAAFVVHEESSQIGKQILDKAIESKQHLILDSTGKNGPKFAATIQRLKDQGYHVTLLMADKDEELGSAHAALRAEAGGRVVPPAILHDAYAAMAHNFNMVARLADDATLYDAPNQRAVWTKRGGEEKTLDPGYLKAVSFEVKQGE